MKMKTVTMVTIDAIKLGNLIEQSGDSKSALCTYVLNKSITYISTCLKNSKMNYDDYKILCKYLNIDEASCMLSTEQVTIPNQLGNGRQRAKRYDKNIDIDGSKLREYLKTNADISLTELSKSLNRNSNYLNQCIYRNTISEKVLRKLCKQLNVSTKDFKPLTKTEITTNKSTTTKEPVVIDVVEEPVVKEHAIKKPTNNVSSQIKEIYERIDKTKQYKKWYSDSLAKTRELINELNNQSNIDLSDLIEDL